MKPGTIQRPRASTCSAPAGIVTAPRGPTCAMRAPSTTSTASRSGAPPLPSMSVAPTIAIVADEDCAERCPSASAVPARTTRVRIGCRIAANCTPTAGARRGPGTGAWPLVLVLVLVFVLPLLVPRRGVGVDQPGAGEQVDRQLRCDDEPRASRRPVVEGHRDDRPFEAIGIFLRAAEQRREDAGAELQRVAGAETA